MLFSGASPEGGPKKKMSKVTSGVIWEWEGDGGKWTPFSNDHSRILCEALTNGDEDVTLQVSTGVKMRIRFDAMTQTNVRTGWQRNIRCVSPPTSSPSPPSSGTHNVWEWQSDDGTWTTYSPAKQRLLHACRLCSVEDVKIEALPGKMSSVDLKAMTHEMGGGKKMGVRCSSLAG